MKGQDWLKKSIIKELEAFKNLPPKQAIKKADGTIITLNHKKGKIIIKQKIKRKTWAG